MVTRYSAGREREKREEFGGYHSERAKNSSASNVNQHPRQERIGDFGYKFIDGKLRTLNGYNGFTFVNQLEYEKLGRAIDLEVYDMLIKAGLEQVELKGNDFTRFYFASPGYQEREKILVLIHGSGVVKAGQWARSLIINDSLERGTQLPYIKRALSEGWGIVVLNYNEKCSDGCDDVSSTSLTQRLFFAGPKRCTPLSHAEAEYSHALPPEIDATIVIVAHSLGGAVASECVRATLSNIYRREERLGRIAAICLTDSHFNGSFERVANWNTDRALEGRVASFPGAVYQLYSGDQTHEGTSAAAIGSIFYVLERVTRRMQLKDFEELLRVAAAGLFNGEEKGGPVEKEKCGEHTRQQNNPQFHNERTLSHQYPLRSRTATSGLGRSFDFNNRSYNGGFDFGKSLPCYNQPRNEAAAVHRKRSPSHLVEAYGRYANESRSLGNHSNRQQTRAASGMESGRSVSHPRTTGSVTVGHYQVNGLAWIHHF